MRLNTSAYSDPALEPVLKRLHARISGPLEGTIRIRFYPYAGLRHTIRRTDGNLELRLSDILESAPFEVVQALSAMLIYKLHGLKAPASVCQPYRDYVNQECIVELALQTRRRRGTKRLGGSEGDHFNLRPLFRRLNSEFFNNEVEVEEVAWSPGKSRRRLGHFDPAHNVIVLSRALDQPHVPEYVVAFVLYHEMLHAFLGEEVKNGRRLKHHAAFREAERDFPDFERARTFLNDDLPF